MALQVPSLLKRRRNERVEPKLIALGVNPVYELAETYLKSLVTDVYDRSWYILYEFITNKEMKIQNVESIVNELLLRPTRTADNAQESAALARLLFILTRVGKLENVNRERLELWLDELQKRKWFSKVRYYASEFHGFFAALDEFRDKNSEIEEILRSGISDRNIRPLLWVLFGLSFSDTEDIKEKTREIVKRLVADYRGIIRDSIIKKDDLEFYAIYLYLIAKHRLYDEMEKVYSEFEKLLLSQLLRSEWILKAIKSAHDIQIGRSYDDVVVIDPHEIPSTFPKILALSLIAIYEAGYNKIAILPARYQKLAQRIREEGLIGLPKNSHLLRWYDRYFLSLILLLPLLGFLFASTFGGVIGVLIDAVIFLLEKRHINPKDEIIDLEKTE